MVRKQAQREFPLSAAEAYRRCSQAMVVLGARIVRDDPVAGRIDAKIGMSFTSWGENLMAQITGDEHRAEIQVTSSSSLPTTLFDFGKNKKNVNRVLDWVSRSQQA